MPELVGEQDGDERESKRQPTQKRCRMTPERQEYSPVAIQVERGKIMRKVELHPRSDDSRCKKGKDQQDNVDPHSRRFAHFGSRHGLVIETRVVRRWNWWYRRRQGRIVGIHYWPSANYYCRVCNSLPGLNRTAFPGGIDTSAPVRGLRPIPVLRGFTLKTPNPRNSIRSPCSKARFM